MNFTFNFSSLTGFFRSFSKPDLEFEVPISSARVKVQIRYSDDKTHYSLRFSKFGNVSYFDLKRHEALELAEALVIASEQDENHKAI